jgi:tRNA threonylcarbamoyladenosine biosynthesis protein TsaB
MKKESIILYIDTTDSQKTIVVIKIHGKLEQFEEKTNLSNKSQNVLLLITKVLKKSKLAFSDITAIEAHTGPGSFTGTRVGISVGNALAWALSISINGQKQAYPTYSPSKFDS